MPAVGYFAGRRLEVAGGHYAYGSRLPDDTARWRNIERLLRLESVFCVELDAAGGPVGLPARLSIYGERFMRASIARHRAHVSAVPAPEPEPAAPAVEAEEALEEEPSRRRGRRREARHGEG